MSVLQIVGDVYIGMYTGVNHSVWFFQNETKKRLLAFFGKELKTEVKLEDQRPMKVLGVGYGRTGTYSLALALNELGYPTLHTQHMYESPAILDMWTQQVFLPAIQSKTLSMGTPDFDLITSHGFSAAVDLPIALYFEEINDRYPDIKFILTTRENSDTWFQSWKVLQSSISEVTNIVCFNGEKTILTHVKQIAWYLRWVFSIVNKDASLLDIPVGSTIPPANKTNAIASYEEHNRRVREVIPKSRLLEYNVKQGWKPLCEFLEVEDCPQIPFPKTNSALSLKVQTVTSFMTPIVVILFFVLLLLRSIRMRKNKSAETNATNGHSTCGNESVGKKWLDFRHRIFVQVSVEKNDLMKKL